jgi:hypothetical protein
MKRLKLIRAWACHQVLLFIGALFSWWPRSPVKARFINKLTGPFAPYAFYWAFRSNKREGWRVKELEK